MISPGVRFYLKTRSSNENVPVYEQNLEQHPDNEQSISDLLDSKFPTAQKRKKIDSSYNCHGMVYANRMGIVGAQDSIPKSILLPGEPEFDFDTEKAQRDIHALLEGNGLKISIDIPDVTVFDEWNKVVSTIMPGDIVTYLSNESLTHSAIIYSVDNETTVPIITLLSKLGISSGEYFHPINNEFVTTLHGTHVRIWTDR